MALRTVVINANILTGAGSVFERWVTPPSAGDLIRYDDINETKVSKVGVLTTKATSNVTLEYSTDNVNWTAFTVFITAPAITAPVIGTIPDQTIAVGASFSLDLSTHLTSDGGDPNITWAVASGILPVGLALDLNTGIVSGTPTTEETQAVGYTATNSAGTSNTSSHSMVVTVSISAPVLGAIPDQDWPVGTAVSLDLNQSVTNNGGEAPNSWAVVTGILPSGVLLDTVTGIVSGTPDTEAAITTIGYTCSNSAGASNESQHGITISAGSSQVVFNDTFTNTAGTDITSVNHTPEIDASGLGWALVTGSVINYVIDTTGDRMVGSAAATGTKGVAISLASAHAFTLTWDVDTLVSNTYSLNNRMLVRKPSQTSADGVVCEAQSVDAGATKNLIISTWIGGTGTEVASIPWTAVHELTTTSYEIVDDGNGITFTCIDSNESVSVTNAQLAGAGFDTPTQYIGVSAGWYADEFRIAELTVASGTGAAISAPTIGTIPDQTPVVGSAYSINLNTYLVSDGGDSNITWALVAGTFPAGITLEPGTGIISGTATAEEAQALSYTATNSAGTSNTSSHTMTTTTQEQLPVAFQYATPTLDMTIGTGTQYYVDNVNGADTNDGLTAGTAFLTIQYGLDLLIAGGTLNIIASVTPYVGTSNIIDREQTASFAMRSSGTVGNPITVRANPGDEGSVHVSGENTKTGFHVVSNDYIQFYGLRITECVMNGIANYSQASIQSWRNVNLSQGCRVENCFIEITPAQPVGFNNSPVAPWASRDWIIRNNKLRVIGSLGSLNEAGVQSYGCIHMLIEHNDIDARTATFIKDFFLEEDDPIRGTTIGAEIRYNHMTCEIIGAHYSIMGTASEESGYQYVHHNIIRGFNGATESMGVREFMSGAGGYSDRIQIEHNIIDMTGAGPSSYGIGLNGMEFSNLNGNIVVSSLGALWTIKYSEVQKPQINDCDYNIYIDTGAYAFCRMDVYSVTTQEYATLATWQAATTADVNTTLTFNNPDTNSVLSTLAALFTDAVNNDYSHLAGSPALGLMADGSNAGAYQDGTEIIGTLPTYSAGV